MLLSFPSYPWPGVSIWYIIWKINTTKRKVDFEKHRLRYVLCHYVSYKACLIF